MNYITYFSKNLINAIYIYIYAYNLHLYFHKSKLINSKFKCNLRSDIEKKMSSDSPHSQY